MIRIIASFKKIFLTAMLVAIDEVETGILIALELVLAFLSFSRLFLFPEEIVSYMHTSSTMSHP